MKSGVVLPLLTSIGRAEPVLTVTVGGGNYIGHHTLYRAPHILYRVQHILYRVPHILYRVPHILLGYNIYFSGTIYRVSPDQEKVVNPSSLAASRILGWQ